LAVAQSLNMPLPGLPVLYILRRTRWMPAMKVVAASWSYCPLSVVGRVLHRPHQIVQ
jgi:hypothetical protein